MLCIPSTNGITNVFTMSREWVAAAAVQRWLTVMSQREATPPAAASSPQRTQISGISSVVNISGSNVAILDANSSPLNQARRSLSRKKRYFSRFQHIRLVNCSSKITVNGSPSICCLFAEHVLLSTTHTVLTQTAWLARHAKLDHTKIFERGSLTRKFYCHLLSLNRRDYSGYSNIQNILKVYMSILCSGLLEGGERGVNEPIFHW